MVFLRVGAVVLGASLFGGCDLISDMFGRGAPTAGPSAAVYRGAMADLSTCVTTTDPAERAASAARLTEAAARLQRQDRPTDPDHFFHADRVRAAADHCAAMRDG